MSEKGCATDASVIIMLKSDEISLPRCWIKMHLDERAEYGLVFQGDKHSNNVHIEKLMTPGVEMGLRMKKFVWVILLNN